MTDHIEIDGKTYAVPAGDNLLKACLSLGLDLPYFCWHPALGSVGACRQCAVVQYQNQDDQRGRIVMACMTPVAEGLRVSLQHPAATGFRAEIIELLMTNHPHDCPVCEEGGECHLQDMTLMTGHTRRIFNSGKRTHRNQYLGPFLNHEMNRCIACYRCVRYYRDYCGGDDLQAFGAHHQVYFGRHADGVLENEFSGNLVEVCPTGVFTDKTFSRHYARKWDLQSAPSVCVHCALGCNTSPGERYGSLRRIANRYHGEVNGYFLCDRGRFGYEFVNGASRIRQPLSHGQALPDGQAAAERFSSLLNDAVKTIGIGSPRASLEANFALRERVGADNFHLGVDDGEYAVLHTLLDVLRHSPVRIASLRQVEQADAVFVLGEDIANTAPRLGLAVRQAARNRSLELADRLKIPRWQDAAVRTAATGERSPVFIASLAETRLDDIATAVFRGTPEDLTGLGFAVAHELNGDAPAVPGLALGTSHTAALIAQSLLAAQRPLIVSGSGCHSDALIHAAAQIAKALSSRRAGEPVDVHFAVPECNSLGLALMGGHRLSDAFAAVESGGADTVVVLENDLYRRAGKERVDRFLAATKQLVVIDHSLHETASKAHLALPAASFAESEGSLVSSEGRVQRFFAVFPITGAARESWRWLGAAAGGAWQCIDGLTAALAQAMPLFEPVALAAPNAGFRIKGQKIPRQAHRYSGRTAMLADAHIHEPKQVADPESALAFSMEGAPSGAPPAINPFVWAPGWNSNQAVNKFQESVGGHLRGGDPGVRLIEPRPQDSGPWFAPVVPSPEVNAVELSRHPGRDCRGPVDKDVALPIVPSVWVPALPAGTTGKILNSTVLPPGVGPHRLRLVGLWHIFGSEELSLLAPALAERVPKPYLALHPDDLSRLGLSGGDIVAITLSGSVRQLQVLNMPGLARGLAGIPVGLPGLPWFDSRAQFWEYEPAKAGPAEDDPWQ